MPKSGHVGDSYVSKLKINNWSERSMCAARWHGCEMKCPLFLCLFFFSFFLFFSTTYFSPRRGPAMVMEFCMELIVTKNYIWGNKKFGGPTCLMRGQIFRVFFYNKFFLIICTAGPHKRLGPEVLKTSPLMLMGD